MQVTDAQADLRRAYVDGGPGVFVSGLVWLCAAITEAKMGTSTAFAVLFIGGMTIFPISLLIDRVVFRRSKENPANPGGMLVLESTIAMIAGLFAAWLFLQHDPALVMPLAAIMVGTHYFAFRTAYGDRAFWVLGAIVTAVGLAAIYRFAPLPGGVTAAVAAIELAFGAWLTVRGLRRAR